MKHWIKGAIDLVRWLFDFKKEDTVYPEHRLSRYRKWTENEIIVALYISIYGFKNIPLKGFDYEILSNHLRRISTSVIVKVCRLRSMREAGNRSSELSKLDKDTFMKYALCREFDLRMEFYKALIALNKHSNQMITDVWMHCMDQDLNKFIEENIK